VLLFFFGLIEEQLRKQLELPLVEVSGDAQILHAGAELVPNLLIERFHKCLADQHVASPSIHVTGGKPDCSPADVVTQKDIGESRDPPDPQNPEREEAEL
jgi:hypothetical protein